MHHTMRRLIVLPLALCGFLAVGQPAQSSGVAVMQSEGDGESLQVEAWPGRKVVLLLPLQLGAGWNADRELGRLVLPLAEQELQRTLEATGKMSVTQPHRFNPLLRRALQENQLTEEQITRLSNEPTLANAREVLSQSTLGEEGGKPLPSPQSSGDVSRLQFDLPPLIAQFSLEEVRATRSGSQKRSRESVTVQVTGRLYELRDSDTLLPPFLPVTFTSDPIITRNQSSLERVLLGSVNAFEKIAAEFVRPVSDFPLPGAEPRVAPGTMSENGMTPMTGTEPSATPDSSIREGGTLPAGTMPQVPPPAEPPLGITVPDRPAANR